MLRFKLYELSPSLARSINDRHDKLGVFLGWLLLNNDEHDKIRWMTIDHIISLGGKVAHKW